MAPPDRSDTPRDSAFLDKAKISEDSRLRGNAERLTSWVEWLLHPEEHGYDRTVFHPGGRKQEEPGPVAQINDQPGTLPPDAQLPFESVIAGYQPWQFLHGMAAVANPQVERAGSPLALAATVLDNIWWIGDSGIQMLVDLFPTIGWTGEAADAAFMFLLRLKAVADQVNKLVKELHAVVPKYAVIVKGVRDSLDEAAAGLVKAFEDKFSSKPESEFSIDFDAAILAGIATAAVTFGTAGGLVLTAAAASVWSGLFTDAAGDLLEMRKDSVGGYWWRDLVESYMHQQAQILTAGTDEIAQLDRAITGLLQRFRDDREIRSFLEVYG
ncbi:hypothetical protein [Actinophytocola sediminis]